MADPITHADLNALVERIESRVTSEADRVERRIDRETKALYDRVDELRAADDKIDRRLERVESEVNAINREVGEVKTEQDNQCERLSLAEERSKRGPALAVSSKRARRAAVGFGVIGLLDLMREGLTYLRSLK